MCFLDLPKMEIASVMLIDRGYDGQFDLAWTVFVLLGIIIADGNRREAVPFAVAILSHSRDRSARSLATCWTTPTRGTQSRMQFVNTPASICWIPVAWSDRRGGPMATMWRLPTGRR